MMDISLWFVIVFGFFWLLGPASQVLQLVAPELHMKMGFMEKRAFEPEFRTFLLYERGTAIADLTHFFGGIVFIWLAVSGSENAPIFGIFVCSVFVFVMVQYLSQVFLLFRENLHPIDKGQLGFIISYAIAFIAFGLYGIYFLWDVSQA